MSDMTVVSFGNGEWEFDIPVSQFHARWKNNEPFVLPLIGPGTTTITIIPQFVQYFYGRTELAISPSTEQSDRNGCRDESSEAKEP